MTEHDFTTIRSLTIKPSKKVINIVGQVFGRLTVFSYLGSRVESKDKVRAYWLCRCICGVFTIRRRSNLFPTASCGCIRATHGGSNTLAFKSWNDMMRRCYNTTNVGYKNYGGRGITVCERWHSFTNFFADMGERPDSLTLERLNVNGNYEPSNCAWRTKKDQARNTRANHLLTYQGETMTIAEWAERYGLKHGTINNRMRYGWSIEDAISLPISHGKYKTRRSQPTPTI